MADNKPKTPIEMILDKVEWKALANQSEDDPSGIPVATHEGILRIGDAELRVYQLKTGERIINEDDLIGYFEGWNRG